ncbi:MULTISPECIES: CPBP family intramembrane glutamic endopeptidase [Liquorilactobacillus]|uniref:CPBP family intramembrane glutamic endopeptidase n=1 Tax=Liquorilactobacillus TaxID=2767888 RepID=UPI001CBF2626|nr:type II CAAX endopeptidase family protein [Liquorilactobacillus hordei]MBZ2406643.1 hypothetical protein [Liquorilactobacillus hordei]
MRKNEVKGTTIILGYIILQVMVMFSQLLILAIVNNKYNYLRIYELLVIILFFIFDVLVFKFTRKKSIKDKWYSFFSKLVFYIFLYLMVEIAFGIAFGRIGLFTNSPFSLYWIASCLLIPIAEELVFRKALYGVLNTYLPTLLAIVLTALCFSIAHMNFGWQFVLNLIFGCYLQYIYKKEDNIIYPITIHSIINFMALI